MTNAPAPRELSEAEKKRLERVASRRGRNRPAKVPARLARTSAFAPKRRGLITDSSFERLYVVRGQSVVRVSGRELGSQHRDALYAVFRLGVQSVTVEDEKSFMGRRRVLKVETTWRELLKNMGLTAHVNNVAGLHFAFQDIKKVVVTVYEGNEEQLLDRFRAGRLPQDAGKMGNMLEDIEWSGLGLDDRVSVSYGEWSANMVMSAKLVSLNADVQFALTSDYAKAFWPYIDSFHRHTWVDEERLAELIGRDLWGPNETASTRRAFRSCCRRAFNDMVSVGGLRSWQEEVRGDGRHKTRRYHYEHGLDIQPELPLPQAELLSIGVSGEKPKVEPVT